MRHNSSLTAAWVGSPKAPEQSPGSSPWKLTLPQGEGKRPPTTDRSLPPVAMEGEKDKRSLARQQNKKAAAAAPQPVGATPTRPGSPSTPTVALGSQALPSIELNPSAGSQARAPMSVVGAYRLLSLLGEGGMGRVYLAEHIKLGRRVALKMLRSEFANNPNAVRRFFDEARAVNQIRHDNIIEVTDFVEGTGGGESYFIMELLVGTDLAQLQLSGLLGLRRVLHIARQVCSALAAAHDAGIVHRDLKPENVFIVKRSSDSEFVKILDFGVAKLTDPLHMVQGQTQAGAILGTPEYMSPEQAGGTAVDHRTDIYAFGVILYELVTGRRPFNGQSFGEYVIAHLSVPPTPPNQLSTTTEPIPEALEALIMQCLAKPPPARPQTMRMVGERLAAIEASFETIRLPSLPRPRKPQRSARFWVLAATMVFLAGVLVQQASARRSREPAAAITAEAMPKVRVTFDSTPQGAQVFREGSDAPLGVTPLEWSTESSSHPERFEFRFPGHNRAWQEIVLDKDSSVSVALAALPPAKPLVVDPPPAVRPAKRLTAPEAARIARASKRAKKAEPEAAPAPAPTAATPPSKADPVLDRDAVADPFSE